MKKSLRLLSIVVILTFIVSIFQNPVYANSKEDLKEVKDERSKIQEELSDSQQKVMDAVEELNVLYNEIDSLQVELAEKEALIDDTEQKMNDTMNDISDLEVEIKELEKKIEERFDILKDRLVSVQQTGGDITYLEVIFGSQSFHDFVNRVSAVNKITDSDAALIEQQELDMKQLEENKQQIVVKLNDLNELKDEQDQMKVEVEEKLVVQKDQQSELEDKKNSLQAMVEELEMSNSELAYLENNIQTDIQKEEEARAKAIAAKEAEKKAQAAKKEAPKREVLNTSTSKKEDKSNSSNDKAKEEKPTSNNDEKTFTVTSTGYTADCKGCSGKTSYNGIDLKKNPNMKVIAVDPEVIPLGSIVEVEGYGVAIAADTGSAIKGKKIDVFISDKNAARSWGVKTVKVTIR
ncbi:PcsB-like coiled-coil domain-containing protein [Oceanobacillus kimchii]|uniref:PcsB-like coiled-coil domain-containing protein n=1 Tax=Oceanobacillus kimchii TaxID=746691 RepID=UPI003B0275B4